MPLGKRTDYGDAKFAGVEIAFSTGVEAAVQEHLLVGFDFVLAPLVRPDHRPPSPAASNECSHIQFDKEDVLYLASSQWASQVVGSVSSWVDPDSLDSQLRQSSCSAIQQQLGWAAHLGLQAVLLPKAPQPLCAPGYARVLQQALSGLTHMALWLTVSLSPTEQRISSPQDITTASGGGPDLGASSSSSTHHTATNGTANAARSQPQSAQLKMDAARLSAAVPSAVASQGADPWETWHQVRSLCDYDPLLGCALEVGQQLPCPANVARWLGEPVKALLLPTSLFGSNKRGYPVLPKPHQELLALFFRHGVQVVVTGPPRHAVPTEGSVSAEAFPPLVPAAAGPTGIPSSSTAASKSDATLPFTVTNPGESHPLRPYWEYLCFLFRKLEVVSEQEQMEGAYRDFLQAPLQPLQDNLESSTYEVFEKDLTKYTVYGEAVYRALLDMVPESEAATTTTVLMVVGAGRGPLVRASMQASVRAGRAIRVYAVEKNPNAIVHIQAMIRSEGWQKQVTLVSADMRGWVAPEPADILVSELLGSFGDNELSPECLDGAQRFLRPGGVSIPQSYTSFLTPMSSHKLYNDVKAYKDTEHCEMPYVVKIHRAHLLAPTQPVFIFEHPNTDSPIDNSRYGHLTFTRSESAGAAVIHGFAGYFESVLYKDVILSTHPPTHTPNMFSWFPIFFPLAAPVNCPAGASVEVQLWRCCTPHKVWYEWSVTAPSATHIHNVGGRSYFVGL